LILAPDAYLNTRRQLIMALAERLRLPAIYGFREFVREGALISYGPDTSDIVRRSASYVDRILKGEKPADLPIQAPNKFELVIRPVRMAEWAPRRFVLATAASNQSTVRATAAATSLCRAVVKPWSEWGDKRVTTLPGQGSGPRQRTCKACAPTRRW
jgi:hypothetical protein